MSKMRLFVHTFFFGGGGGGGGGRTGSVDRERDRQRVK